MDYLCYQVFDYGLVIIEDIETGYLRTTLLANFVCSILNGESALSDATLEKSIDTSTS